LGDVHTFQVLKKGLNHPNLFPLLELVNQK